MGGRGRGGGGGVLLFLQILDCGNAVAAWRVELYYGGFLGKGRGRGGVLLFLQFLDCGSAVAAWRDELYDGGIVRVEKPSVWVLGLV